MTSNTLIFKDKLIRENDVELTFHKDVFWVYNDDPYPVIKFTLKNCSNLEELDFSSIDYYNDGLTIEIKQVGNHFVFETTDMGNIKVTAYCDKIKKEEFEYSSNYYICLIKEFAKQRNEAYNSLTILNEQIDSLKQYLSHEIDVISRKTQQANWLTDDKKHFLEGRKDIIKIIFDKLDKKKD